MLEEPQTAAGTSQTDGKGAPAPGASKGAPAPMAGRGLCHIQFGMCTQEVRVGFPTNFADLFARIGNR